MRLASLTRPELIFPGLEAPDRSLLLRELARQIAQQSVVSDSAALFSKLWEREELASTAIGGGVAVPHCKVTEVDRVVLAVAVMEEGVDFLAPDREPVRLFFCIVSPSASPAAHLQCLAAISRWVKDKRHVDRLLELRDPEAIYQLLVETSEEAE